MNTTNIKTWSCACGYSQDFEPTKQNFDIHFNNDKDYLDRMVIGKNNGKKEVSNGECPSCKMKGMSSLMSEQKDIKKMISTGSIIGDKIVPDTKEHKLV